MQVFSSHPAQLLGGIQIGRLEAPCGISKEEELLIRGAFKLIGSTLKVGVFALFVLGAYISKDDKC